jgi:aldehyde:ferredoxin oxidoreductase
VTGDKLSFEDGIELGRRIWNLDNAIWTLQGRHRDMVHFAPYVYETSTRRASSSPSTCGPAATPNGEWAYRDVMGRSSTRKFEEFKTIFYRLEGWDAKSGWPKRTTLEKMDMAFVADELAKAGRIGAEA